MKTVFVVLGEYGEYESHTVFISGVFETKPEAEAAVAQHLENRRAYDRWSEAVSANWPRLPLGYFKFPLRGDQLDEHARITANAEQAAGPKPEYEPAEEASIYEVPIGLWHSKMLEPS